MPEAEPDVSFGERPALLAGGYGDASDPDDPAQVLAMPIVLHIPKRTAVDRDDLLSAAASAVVRLCLDRRVGVGGEWHDDFAAWMHGRIRKVARRARGAQWVAAQDVPGVTVTVGGAEARAFVPVAVGSTDPRIRRLQIGGTELAAGQSRPADVGVPVLWIDPRLGMTVGKAAAQVGHASMLLAAALPVEAVERWADTGFALAVRDADPDQWSSLCQSVEAGQAVAVHDAGFTEVQAGTRTVIATAGPSEVPEATRPRAARVSPDNVGQDGNCAGE